MPIRAYLKATEIAAFEPKDILEMSRALEMACHALDIEKDVKDRQVVAEHGPTCTCRGREDHQRPRNRGGEGDAVSMMPYETVTCLACGAGAPSEAGGKVLGAIKARCNAERLR